MFSKCGKKREKQLAKNTEDKQVSQTVFSMIIDHQLCSTTQASTSKQISLKTYISHSNEELCENFLKAVQQCSVAGEQEQSKKQDTEVIQHSGLRFMEKTTVVPRRETTILVKGIINGQLIQETKMNSIQKLATFLKEHHIDIEYNDPAENKESELTLH